MVLVTSNHGDGRYFTKRRLEFPQNRLYGREIELSRLSNAYQRLCLCNDDDSEQKHEELPSMAEMVLLAGYSGTGKSSLVRTFRERLAQQARRLSNENLKPCRFIRGVYEDQKTDPFSALSCALSSYCKQLVEENDQQELLRVTLGIQNAVGQEGKVLTDMIPELNRFIVGEKQSAFSTTLHSNQNSMNRLKFLFQSLMEVICGNGSRPIVLFLDDLQRADAASLELITSLLTTESSSVRHLLFVGAFRSNEVDEHHPLTVALKRIEEKRRGKPAELIEMTNLPRELINQFLSRTLGLESCETQSLTDAIYSKTEGNILYTMHALEQLNQAQVLAYDSFRACRWVWDVDRICNELALSDNVVDVITSRITRLPERLQRALTIGAFLRSAFDLHTVERFMETELTTHDCFDYESDSYDYNLVELLDLAVAEGFLENEMGSTTYTFAHDRIQQAAYSLIPDGDTRDLLKLRLGEYLAKIAFTDEGEEWMMFVAADHLNATLVHVAKGAAFVDLARLNLTVGERAVSLAGFIPASAYFKKGIEALQRSSQQPWKVQYELALHLYRSASSIELSIGDFDFGWSLAHELFDNAETILETMPTYMSLVEALSRLERYTEALELVQKALELLGEFPTTHHRKHTKKNYAFVKRALKAHTNDDIVVLPRMTNLNKLMAMELLSQLTHRAFQVNKMTLVRLANSQQLRMMFEDGLCGAAAQALSAYALLLRMGSLDDDKTAQRMAGLAREVLQMTKEKQFEAFNLYIIAAHFEPWFAPLSSATELLHKSHLSGMESGDFELGFRSFFHFQLMAYASGRPLDHIDENGIRMTRLMKQYNVTSVWSTFDHLRVLVLTLIRGQSEVDWRDPFPDKGSLNGRAWYCYARLQLAFFFGDTALADMISTKALELDLGSKKERCFVFVSHTLFFSGLIALELALKTRKRKYWLRASRLRKELKSRTSKRGLNILHQHYILEAQYSALRGRRKDKKIRAAFDKAISASSRAGFRQDAAIASELAGKYFLRLGDRFWSRHYFSHAYQEYRDWGAHGKARHLLNEHMGLIDKSSCLESSPFERSQIMQGEACHKHRAINLDSLTSSMISAGSVGSC